MLDQNTTAVLTSLITVGGTLGGVILGVILSNRYISRQDKAKHNIATIEEIYTLLTNINSSIRYNINHDKHPTDEQQINDNLRRVQVLIPLYFPLLKKKFEKFSKSLSHFSVDVWEAQQAHNPDEVWELVSETHKQYKETLDDLKLALENLVK